MLVVFLTAMSGCLGAGSLDRTQSGEHRYVLAAERVHEPGTAGAGVLRIGRIGVSPLFDRKSFVYRTGEEAYENHFSSEFFAPPSIMLHDAVHDWLNSAAIFAAVINSASEGDAEWLLEGRKGVLYADLRGGGAPKAVLTIEFTLFDVSPSHYHAVLQRSYGATVAAADHSPAAVATAWNEALRQVLSSLENDLVRALAG